MEYVQERIATLHEFGGTAGRDGDLARAAADAVAETAVVVPMTAREHENPAAERVLSELESLDPSPAAVFVPVRADANEIDSFRGWLESFALPIRVLWCNSPRVDALLADAGLDGEFGKGRDVWLALGPAADAGEYVVVHDADARSYEAGHVPRLLAPLTMDYAFSKGYYARVEDGRLYGRLFRLFYAPLVRALADRHDAPILDYLRAFRYPLAGEFAATAALARRLRAPRAWGLEVGTLGDAFDAAGFDGAAQVDLGRHEHDHRAVAGETGLEGMSREVAGELLRVVEERGVDPDYETLQERYLAAGERLIEQYRADAAFNGLTYDSAAERDQLARYAGSIAPPDPDRRLPPWTDAPVTPEAIVSATLAIRNA
ncbi:glycosyltransferase involved in cell wall biogenesis [Haloterrigena turkmenica DSM 5511]|uniref:Glycosyltransferase involved in cell wall biogenesis n=1 Tax=Haloterrigena turkmenica (strain ATCC 51198 / DSM 5511 / JCM 9101 / NCIMB 13204 / VKM B-1734 / 4k) TaxID=543526 RepID=D2RPE3_HALTV|nr:glycosyl transferase family 2 [Haloterrigena turkmenica]ADB60177.1 glycosyltransferase involved in cell wall biogenesis [Haloterrigena turkmenica DSM 5511]